MQITAVEPRRKGLSALYIDGEFAMNLDTQTLIEHRFTVGKEIDDDDLHEIIALSNEHRAKEKALWLISYRDHSKKELTDKIKRTYDEEFAEKAVNRLEELGLINDEGFAKRYAEQLLQNKKMSKRAVARELAFKGIDKDIIDDILEEIDVDTHEQIRTVLNKKYKNLSDEKIKRRAVSALQRLGHSWDDIRQVIEEYTEDDYE